MKKLLMLSVVFAWAHAIHAAEADHGRPTALENRFMSLEVHAAPAPFVGRLVHKPSGQAVVDNPAARNLFSITLAKDDGGQETIDSGQAGASSVKAHSAAGQQGVTLRFAKFPAAPLAVEVTATCPPNDPWTLWSVRVENPTGRRIKAIRFPQVSAVPKLGDPRDDFLLLPALPGTLIENPVENWRAGQSVALSYPGNLSAQFLAYQDRSAGVYLAGMDPAGYPMSLAVVKRAEGFAIWHEFAPVADARNVAEGVPYQGKRWESPYPVALGVTHGRWYDTADQYKRWAVRQPWCARKLAERDDIPAWWKQGPDVHVVCVRTYDSQRQCNGSYYPKLLEHLRTLRQKIGGPIVAMLAGWENHRRWTAGDYFPIFDQQNALPVIAQIKQEGFRPFLFLSGLYFTFWNEGRDGGRIPAAEQHAASYVIDEKTGRPAQYTLDESSPRGQWRRHSYQFCPAAPQTKEFFAQVVQQAHALGIDVLQMDQTVAGAGAACYATEHGHAPGAGRYQTAAFCDLLQHMRRRGKELSQDFVLFHEEPHEQLIPYLDGFHVREYYEKRWYRAYPGAIGIPLFAYLYHEYALGYGGDSAGLSKHNSRWLVRCHAMNLVTGRTPGGAIWSSPQSMFEAHPDQIAVLRSHCRLLKTRAKDFLLLGQMLHPLELDVPQLTIQAPVDRPGQQKSEVLTPAVLTSSWLSPAGRIGHVFVNISESPQTVKVLLDARNAPAAAPCDAAIYRGSQDESFRPLWRAARLPQPFTTAVAPLEVVFVEIGG